MEKPHLPTRAENSSSSEIGLSPAPAPLKELDPDDFETLARLINECLGRRKHRRARNRLVELRERVVAHKLTHSIERHTEYYDVVDGQFRLSRVRCRDCSYDIEIKPLSPPPPPCPNEGCACDISTRHEWFIAFCEEREKLKHSPQPPTPDVFPAIENALAKHCRGFMDRPTTRENIAELVEKVCEVYNCEVQHRQTLQRQLGAVDRAIGFPTDEGLGRIEVIQRLGSPQPPTSETLKERLEKATTWMVESNRIADLAQSLVLARQAEDAATFDLIKAKLVSAISPDPPTSEEWFAVYCDGIAYTAFPRLLQAEIYVSGFSKPCEIRHLGSPQPPSEARLPQALALMNIREWVDEGIAIQEREYGHVSVPGLASNVAAQVWLHVQNALSAETPTVCLCGHSRAAHTYYRTGGIFTACKACKCEAYEPGVAPPRSPGETS